MLQEDEERALFAFEPRLDSPGQCAGPIAEQVWLSNVPAGSQVLRERHEGADGCTRLSFGQELQALPERAPALSEADGGLLHSPEGGDAGSVSPGAQDAGAPEPTDPVGPAPRVYPYSLELCVPSDVIPFSAGDEVQVVSTSPATLEVSSHQATLTVFRVGGESGQFETTAVSAQDSACPWQVIDTPLQTKRPASLLFQTELGSVTLENGESRTQLGTVSQVTLGNLGSFELALSAREAAAPNLTHFLSGYRLERDVF